MEKKLALVCKYSPICNQNCEKCQHLKHLQTVDLSTMTTPTLEQQIGCECG